MRRLSCILAVCLGGALGLASCNDNSDEPETGGQTGTGGSVGGEGSGGRPASSGGAVSGTGAKPAVDSPYATCASSETGAQLTPANLLFVLDRSGSMNCNPPNGDVEMAERCKTDPVREDPSKPSKWEVTEQAFSAALEGLVGQENVSVAVSVFPKPYEEGQSECTVRAAPDVAMKKLDAGQKQAIDGLLANVHPDGKTPIAGATILAYQYLSEQLRAEKLEGNTFVVLFTDGAETCDGSDVVDKFVSTDVPNSRLFGMRTFVIGAPGSEDARSLLSEIAFTGGTPADAECVHGGDDAWVGNCHFDTTQTTDFAADLRAALMSVTDDKALSCVFDVPEDEKGGTVDLDSLNVTFSPSGKETKKVRKDDSAACDGGANGWQYSSDHTRIVLCGAICDEVKADEGGEVRIVLGCPTETVFR